LYKAGEQWNLSPEEITLLDEFMKGYEFSTIERELIKNLYIPGTEDQQESVRLTVAEIIKELQEYYPSARLSHVRVGKELTAMGFKQKSVRKGMGVLRGYECIRISNKVGAKL
jgi:hypothetical protein